MKSGRLFSVKTNSHLVKFLLNIALTKKENCFLYDLCTTPMNLKIKNIPFVSDGKVKQMLAKDCLNKIKLRL
jgi:hypothetical protein